MSKTTSKTIRFLALPGLLLAAAALAPSAHAQIVNAPVATCGSTTPGGTTNICTNSNALTGTTCGYARGGTGCTANDFVGQASVTSNTITNCHFGDVLTGQSLTFVIQSGSPTRYSPGLFIGEQNQPLNAAGGTCSVATFPTTNTETPARVPFPWFAANVGDACGSYNGNFTSTEQINNVTLKCAPDANGNLGITFMVAYAQNSAGAAACTGPANVAPGTTSKCTFGGTPVANVVVTYNADPGCSGKDVTYDPAAGTITSVITFVNNDPLNQVTPDAADGTTFEDVVPGPAVVTNVTCTSADGAVCNTTGTTGNDVKGTITTFPTGSHVTLTITSTVASGLTGLYSNTADLTPPVNLTPGSDATGNNMCTGSTTLPVKVQSFDVN